LGVPQLAIPVPSQLFSSKYKMFGIQIANLFRVFWETTNKILDRNHQMELQTDKIKNISSLRTTVVLPLDRLFDYFSL
jgi:hypothetical protein